MEDMRERAANIPRCAYCVAAVNVVSALGVPTTICDEGRGRARGDDFVLEALRHPGGSCNGPAVGAVAFGAVGAKSISSVFRSH